MTANIEPDAACLREAAAILRRRARRNVFGIMLVIRVLEKAADRIDQGTE